MIDLVHFDIEEFNCPCCGGNRMVESTLKRFDQARQIAQVAFKVNSGYRCPKHNLEVGGKPTSSHTLGFGADLECLNSGPRFMILDGLIRVGFTRIGIGKTFIHADDDSSKDQGVVWLY